MEYIDVHQAALVWGVSERSVRNYCAEGKIDGAFLRGKTWLIPESAEKPPRKRRQGKIPTELLPRLRLEKGSNVKGGIYHKIQIELTYNSNHIEGSQLTHEQTRFIYETNTVGLEAAQRNLNVDDIIETANHFRCIDKIIEMANHKLTEAFIKQLHYCLKYGTSDSKKSWFAVGDYKRLQNEIGGTETVPPIKVAAAMKKLLKDYNKKNEHTLQEIIEFHHGFEKIHPFQDGNGRIGRLIMFKECMKNKVTPFIIGDDLKEFYYRGLKEWFSAPGYLLDTCLAAQDRFKNYMDYFGLKY